MRTAAFRRRRFSLWPALVASEPALARTGARAVSVGVGFGFGYPLLGQSLGTVGSVGPLGLPVPLLLRRPSWCSSSRSPTSSRTAAPLLAPAADAGWWYYCDQSSGYYPYVRECPTGWQRVPPVAPAQMKRLAVSLARCCWRRAAPHADLRSRHAGSSRHRQDLRPVPLRRAGLPRAYAQMRRLTARSSAAEHGRRRGCAAAALLATAGRFVQCMYGQGPSRCRIADGRRRRVRYERPRSRRSRHLDRAPAAAAAQPPPPPPPPGQPPAEAAARLSQRSNR